MYGCEINSATCMHMVFYCQVFVYHARLPTLVHNIFMFAFVHCYILGYMYSTVCGAHW